MGLLEFIFGKSAPKDDSQSKQAYYLNDDDAKSFGNIEYMRSSKTVRRTFAKKKGQQEHLESIRQISALQKADLANNSANFGVNSSASTPASSVSNSNSNGSSPRPRRKGGSDMDMFRNMAKDIRK